MLALAQQGINASMPPAQLQQVTCFSEANGDKHSPVCHMLHAAGAFLLHTGSLTEAQVQTKPCDQLMNYERYLKFTCLPDAAQDQLQLKAISKIQGHVKLPGSKSLSNRILLLAALAQGTTRIENLLVSPLKASGHNSHVAC